MNSRLLIRGGVLAIQGRPQRGDILCEGPRILAIGRDISVANAEVLDATGLTLGPGFIDIHVHGGGGFSFFTKDHTQVRSYADWAPRNGVTSFLISTLGRDDSETETVLASLAPTVGQSSGAEALGFHLEGPFINPARKGAFDERMLRTPIQEEYARYQQAARGFIRQVTIAPELPWALDVIAAIHHAGAVPAMGHTDATVEQARLGFETGVVHVTHLFNAMRPIHQREGGPIVAALMEEAVTCELICDGAHVAPDLLRLAYRSLGPNRAVVVTDNLAIAGTHQESGTFGGHDVSTKTGVAVRDDGVITGSVVTMDQHFRNAVAFLGVEPATAFRLCATNPARVIGMERRKGALDRGMDADIVLLDGNLQVAATVCRGEVVYRR